MYWPNSPNQPSPTISASELDTRRLHLNRLTINKLSISMYAKTLLLVDEWIKDECFVIVFVSAYQQSTKVQYAGCLIMMATWVFILVCLFNWTMHQHQTEANSYQNCTFDNDYPLHLTYFLIFAHMLWWTPTESLSRDNRLEHPHTSLSHLRSIFRKSRSLISVGF